MNKVSNGDNPGPEMHIILIQILKVLLSPSWRMGGSRAEPGETALANLRHIASSTGDRLDPAVTQDTQDTQGVGADMMTCYTQRLLCWPLLHREPSPAESEQL